MRTALDAFRSGAWDDGQWTAFRLRYGIYGQLQPNVQMVRIKVPGGVVGFDSARAVAGIARDYAKGDVHLTTRQDFQIYFVETDRTPDLVADLASAGLTTREACGNTLRNFTACPLAGVCPREHVDAGAVAQSLAQSWLRHPLVQNMPRKFKATVSGCATDCGASGIHDLGLIATDRDGAKGFRVLAGGGTGGQPQAAVEVLDFVAEDALPAVLETAVRLHQRYSNRVNRNAARLKFLVKRFGAAKFAALFAEEFARLRALPQRPWPAHAWRQPDASPAPSTPHGVFDQHDGLVSVVVSPPLGLLAPDQLERLADLGEAVGAVEFRTTRDQNIAIVGVAPATVADLVANIRALGLAVQDAIGDIADIISCPGTTTCRVGITNSQDFGRELEAAARAYEAKRNVTIRISGCQNGCGLHHVADFGFRGMGKKIDGVNAPHYQIYLGGNDREVGAIGFAGPIVPASHAKTALELLMAGYADGRAEGESVRGWARRLGAGRHRRAARAAWPLDRQRGRRRRRRPLRRLGQVRDVHDANRDQGRMRGAGRQRPALPEPRRRRPDQRRPGPGRGHARAGSWPTARQPWPTACAAWSTTTVSRPRIATRSTGCSPGRANPTLRRRPCWRRSTGSKRQRAQPPNSAARELDAGGVLGNHDLHLLRRSAGKRKARRDDTFQDVLEAEDRKQLCAWLAAKPLIVDYGDVLLVHAGIHPLWKDPIARLADNDPYERDEDSDFVTRVRFCDANGVRPENDEATPPRPFRPWFKQRLAWDPEGRTIVFGHWAQRGWVKAPGLRGLDTGCVWGGRLTAWIAEEDRRVDVLAERAWASIRG